MNAIIGDINNVFIELSSSTVCDRLTYQMLLHKGYPSYNPRTHFDASRVRNIYGTYNVTEGEKNLSNISPYIEKCDLMLRSHKKVHEMFVYENIA